MRSDSAAARGISQRMGCGRVRHLDCALMWVQNATKEKALKAGPIAGVRNPADIGAKALSGLRLRELLGRAGAITEDLDMYGAEAVTDAEHRASLRQITASGAVAPRQLKKILPVLLVLAQVLGSDGVDISEGLSLAMGLSLVEEAAVSSISSCVTTVLVLCFWIGAAWICLHLSQLR